MAFLLENKIIYISLHTIKSLVNKKRLPNNARGDFPDGLERTMAFSRKLDIRRKQWRKTISPRRSRENAEFFLDFLRDLTPDFGR